MLLIPFRLGFRKLWNNPNTDPIFYAFDYVGDCIMMIDIVLNFRTVFISDGLEVRDPYAIGQSNQLVLKTQTSSELY